jgi:hypothetical protein
MRKYPSCLAFIAPEDMSYISASVIEDENNIGTTINFKTNLVMCVFNAKVEDTINGEATRE